MNARDPDYAHISEHVRDRWSPPPIVTITERVENCDGRLYRDTDQDDSRHFELHAEDEGDGPNGLSFVIVMEQVDGDDVAVVKTVFPPDDPFMRYTHSDRFERVGVETSGVVGDA